jgi:thiol-disulfide isomerase/thioredoxin
MPKKKKKKESWKEKRRRAALKRERTLEAERIRREIEPKKKQKGWSRGKVFGVLFLILLCLVSYGVWYAMQPSTNSSKAPSFALNDINGATFSLADFKGKVVVLNFFDTHCPPCVREIPYLAEIHREYSSSEVVILSIDIYPYHDTVSKLQQFREEYQINWTIAMGTLDIADDYKIQYTPTTVVVDQDGFLYETHIGWNEDPNHGPLTYPVLISEIEYLLGR